MRAPAPRYASNDGVIEAAQAALGGLLVESKDAVGEVSLTVARESLVHHGYRFPGHGGISVGDEMLDLRRRRIPSRTSGCLVRRSIATKSAKIAAAIATPPIVRAEPQPWSGASTTV